MKTKRHIAILGSTGSIGTSTLKVAGDLPDRLRLTPLGEMVLAHVRSTLREHAALREHIAEFKGLRRGDVIAQIATGDLTVRIATAKGDDHSLLAAAREICDPCRGPGMGSGG